MKAKEDKQILSLIKELNHIVQSFDKYSKGKNPSNSTTRILLGQFESIMKQYEKQTDICTLLELRLEFGESLLEIPGCTRFAYSHCFEHILKDVSANETLKNRAYFGTCIYEFVECATRDPSIQHTGRDKILGIIEELMAKVNELQAGQSLKANHESIYHATYYIHKLCLLLSSRGWTELVTICNS